MPPYEPPRSTPWAFVPPPAVLSSVREPRFHQPSSQNRRQQTQRVSPWVNSNPHPPSSDARHPSPQTQRGWAGRSRRHTVSSNTTDAMAKCTKCNISFPDALSLGEHFAESPAHPYSVRAPSNSWEAPAFMEYTTEPAWRETQPLPFEPETRTPLYAPSGSRNATKVTCECGKAFGTNSSLEQHRKTSMRHKARTEVRIQPGVEGVLRRSKGQVWAWANDEIDDIASAFTQLFVV